MNVWRDLALVGTGILLGAIAAVLAIVGPELGRMR